MEILECKNLTFQGDNKKIIDDISLKVDKGDFISIVGPSGSGKSTFLKLVADLISPSSGELFCKGKNYLDYEPTDLRKNIMMVFQTPYLFGDTVLENLRFPYEIRNKKIDKKRISELFSEFSMSEDFIHKDVNNLSGGEKQRIALIRSLIFEPEILLLDEVTSALDVKNTELVEKIIEKRNKNGKTVMWITHDLEQSEKYANKIIEIKKGKLTKEEVLK